MGRAVGMSIEELPDRNRASARGRSLRFFKRFLRNRSGSTAIEFTFLALPFSALVFAILESCISFAGQEVLANTTDDIARQMRTGQKRTGDINETTLHKMICDRLEIIVADGCPGLVFDVRPVTTFADAAALGRSFTGKKVELGPALSKNVLRVSYQWPTVTNYAGWLNKDTGDGNPTTHFAMAVWQNEPFDD